MKTEPGSIEELDNEILRLKLRSKDLEARLRKKFNEVQHQGPRFFFKAFFGKRKNRDADGEESFFQSEPVRNFTEKVSSNLAEKVIALVEKWAGKIFGSKS
jgi:hypothetical protein